jgi:isopentenyl-diphosphate delta-isomerase
MTAPAQRVSFDDEPLILVDDQDKHIGYMPKLQAHQGEGVLHRAFSVFLFNDAGELLLQKRSEEKPLWPLFWSNSCCSHPRKGEELADAVHRRIREELNITSEPHYLYKFHYHAPFGAVGSEHELCHVYVGKIEGEVAVNPTEIAEWRFVSPDVLDKDMDENPDRYTPWFKMEWPRIRRDHWAVVVGL